MPNRKFLIVSLVILAVLLALTGVVYAITHGELDGDGHPYVGMVLFFDENDEYLWRCTGTLLSPTVFLTAGHCTSGTVTAKVAFDADLSAPATSPEVCGMVSCYDGVTASHPEYDDYWSQFPNTYDVGLVLLNAPVNMPVYGQLAALGTLDSFSNRHGQQDRIIRTVGYGDQSGHPWWNSERIRYTSTSKIIEINSANTGGFGLRTSNNPGKGHGTGGACFGDSGGPLFYPQDSNTVVAVVSWGPNYTCTGGDYSYRTDIADAQDFINGYLP